jgi:hypothetical protein
VLVAAAVTLPSLGAQPAIAQEAPNERYAFQLGFLALRNQIPLIVGDPLENEWHNPENGDGLQRTTGGLLVWRKADNWTAFTNGYATWINGPFGLQSRLNSERFYWEPMAAPIPQPPPEAPSFSDVIVDEPTQSDLPAEPAAPTNERPKLTLRVSDTTVKRGEAVTIRIEAQDDHGIDRVWWWATSTDDLNLQRTRSSDCNEVAPCHRSWTVSTDDPGTFTIHALARDTDGVRSTEVTRKVEVKR